MCSQVHRRACAHCTQGLPPAWRAPNITCLEFYNNGRLGVIAEILKLNHNVRRSVSPAYNNLIGVTAARFWILLLRQVNCKLTLNTFKIILGDFLAHFSNNSRVPGYTPPNSNVINAVRKEMEYVRDKDPNCDPAKPFNMYIAQFVCCTYNTQLMCPFVD